MGDGTRQKQLASVLKRELSIYLRENHSLKNGFVNINDAKVSKQIEFADVYITLFGVSKEEEQEVISNLNEQAKEIRKYLSAVLSWRKTPAIRFHIDSGLEHARQMEEKFLHIERTTAKNKTTP